MAQFGRAIRSGRMGRWFESSHLDHIFSGGSCKGRQPLAGSFVFLFFVFLGRFGARRGGGAPDPFAPVTARRIMPSLRGTYFIIEILSPLKNILNNFYIQK